MMHFEQSFDLGVSIADAWSVISDLEQVVPCLPGAHLDSVDGGDFTGKVAVKVGPIQVKYRGRGTVTVCDESSWTMTIDAKGAESSGTGTASATVSARLEAVNETACRMYVSASYEVTGSPARFGNGVMVEVAGRILQKFTDNVSRVVAHRGAATVGSTAGSSAHESAVGGDLTVLDLVPSSWLRGSGFAAAFALGVLVAIVGARVLTTSERY